MSEDTIGLIDVHDRLLGEAVKAERKRAAGIVERRLEQSGYSEGRWFDVLNEIRSGFVAPQSPPDEPVTIEKLLEKMRAGYPIFTTWDELEADLKALVENEARRIANLIRNAGLGHVGITEPDLVADQILRSAGLE